MDQRTRPPATPFWNVVAVFDPDAEGADFAYTVGLHTAGAPELHMWARPTSGDDPGEDWKFNPREQTMLLNDLADRLLTGRLAPGQQVTELFDGGATEVTFSIGDPVPPADVEAYQADDNATVLPVRWELRREPEGTLGPILREHRDHVLAQITAVRATLPADVPDQWRVPTGPAVDADLDPDGPYGPLSDLVTAYAAAVASADVATLADLCENAMLAEQHTGPRAVLALTQAAARPVGRRRAVAATRDLAQQLVDHITTSTDAGADGRRWSDVVEALAGEPADADDHDEFGAALRHLLMYATAALLSTAAVADVADERLRLAGLGPWAYATTGTTPPGWEVPPDTAAAVVALTGRLDADAVPGFAKAASVAIDDEAYQQAYHRLRGFAVTARGGVADPLQLLTAPARTAVDALDPQSRADLQAALCTLVAAHAHPDLPAGHRAALVAAFADVLPDLDANLHTLAANRPTT